LNNKKMNRITAIAVTLSVFICFVFMFLPKGSIESAEYSLDYPEKLFGTDMIEINIKADKDAWQSMLDNAISESYIACDITVNGTTFSSVGVRPKGNSSLSMVAGSDSDRFSFKFQFDEYIDGQTCFGLDKLVINNMQADYTYMKEYFSYYLMSFMGVDSPMVNYAHITVNGEEWGLYLAVECYEDSFVERMYNSSDGNLYSVKTAMGRGKEEPGAGVLDGAQDGVQGAAVDGAVQGKSGAKIPDANQDAVVQGKPGTVMPDGIPYGMPDAGIPYGIPDEMQDGIQGKMRDGNLGGFGGSSGGGSLVYTDDNSESYSSILGNAVFNESNEEDYQRVIEALKKLSKGEELEKYFNVDQILRYFAVHTTVVNLDSYISNMQQNYYLYEKDGKVTILPWDYNLAFGGFQSGDASAAVNFTIDTPVSGVELSQRPLIGKLLEVHEYKERYHQYLQEIASYLSGGQFVEQVQTVDGLISDYVENDATAFCTYNQYKSAAETFKQFCLLRAESIQGQLDGTIPSTTSGQSGSSALVDASGINLSTMGSQGGGGDKGGMAGFGRGDIGNMGGRAGIGIGAGTGAAAGKAGAGTAAGEAGAGIAAGGAGRFEGSVTTGDAPTGAGNASRFGQMPSNGNLYNGQPPAETPNIRNGVTSFPQRKFSDAGTQNPQELPDSDKQGILWFGVSVMVLAIGIWIALIYKRR